jgi:ABC-2 type transport system permease protein
MSDVIAVSRAELFALVRRPAVWTIFGAIAALNQVFSYLVPYLSYRSGDTTGFTEGMPPDQVLASTLPAQLVPNTLGGFPVFAGALALAWGALVFGSEYGWGTMKTLFTQRPTRLSVLGGKMLAMAVSVVVSVIALFCLGAMTSLLIAVGEGASTAFPSLGHLSTGIAGGALIMMMWASLGAALAVMMRSVALPIGLGIVWALGIENLVSAMATSMLSALEPLRNALPGVNAGSLVGAITPERIGEAAPGVTTAVAEGQALLTLAAYVVVCVGAAGWLYQRRDVT